MVTIELDPRKETRLREMAVSRVQEVAELARRIVEEYIEQLAWSDSEADWAESSVAMTSEVLEPEDWPYPGESDGPTSAWNYNLVSRSNAAGGGCNSICP